MLSENRRQLADKYFPNLNETEAEDAFENLFNYVNLLIEMDQDNEKSNNQSNGNPNNPDQTP
ncbi:MAG: hypothetical protein WC570_00235 [Patescibacteria group bacterium]